MNRLQRQVLGLDEQLHDLQAYVQGERTFLLHQAMWDDWQRLRHSAKQAGFDLAIVSSYRDFARQKKYGRKKPAVNVRCLMCMVNHYVLRNCLKQSYYTRSCSGRPCQAVRGIIGVVILMFLMQKRCVLQTCSCCQERLKVMVLVRRCIFG